MLNLFFKRSAVILFCHLAVIALSTEAQAQEATEAKQVIFGFKVSAGGRFDNVRMCVGSPPGAKGGPAMDISFFTELGLKKDMSLFINVPVMRPLLFAAAFKMLQFEPEVALLFRHTTDSSTDVVMGPSLGVTLHYGPDYHSDRSGADRGPSFFAMGPKIGGYLGLDFKRPNETFNFQLGLSPYLSPLFSIDDPDDHKGVVIGGSLDALFRFSAK